ncbi:MAG: hypothetical protein ACREBG_17335 [Pyrinomonadaceae bacterium]
MTKGSAWWWGKVFGSMRLDGKTDEIVNRGAGATFNLPAAFSD